jgi:hypothetical protein
MSWAVVGFGCQALLWKRKMARKEAMTAEEREDQDARGVVGDERYDFKYVRLDLELGSSCSFMC